MPCTREAPCCGPVRETMRTKWVVLRSCLNGHTFREELEPEKEDLTAWRGVHTGRGEQGEALMHPRQFKADRRCPWCPRTKGKRCVKHGGPTRRERDKSRRGPCGHCSAIRKRYADGTLLCAKHGGPGSAALLEKEREKNARLYGRYSWRGQKAIEPKGQRALKARW